MLHFWLIDDLYSEPYGRTFLNSLRTPQYVNWLTRIIRPYLGDRVLELGAGIGNLCGSLMGRRLLYVAAEKDPLYLHALGNRFLRTPNVKVAALDPEVPDDFAKAGGPFDTVLCINLLEYLDNPELALHAATRVLKPGGTMIVLSPQCPALYGTLDLALGQRQRFSRAGLRAFLEKNGLRVKELRQINKVGAPGWWLFSKVLRRKHLNKPMLKLFDKTIWIWRRIDGLLPWRGLSLIAVATKE